MAEPDKTSLSRNDSLPIELGEPVLRDGGRRSRRLRPQGGSFLLMLSLVVIVVLGGCYGAQDIRERAELVEDPRAAEMKKLWQALEGTLTDAGYGIELNRPQDKIITTSWIPSAEGLRRRVRMTLVITNMGIGMNATVTYQRLMGDTWQKVEGDRMLAQAAKTEEQMLVRAAYTRWTGQTLE